MKLEIRPIPTIPPTLYFAAGRNELVPFIGAGVSALAGTPNWSSFAQKAFDPFIQVGKFNHAARELLRDYPDRMKLSIASSLQDKDTRISYQSILHPSKRLDDSDGLAAYGYIGKLSRVLVTTNYDNWAERILVEPAIDATTDSVSAIPPAKTRKRYYLPRDFRPEYLLQEDVVFHLHGCVLDEENMVVTTRNYLEHYASRYIDAREQNQTLVFLRHLFERRNVLFIGYSLSELEILEYVLQKSHSEKTTAETPPRHYILMGFHSHESQIVGYLGNYYREIGVGLLPFLRDELNYRQLINVLEYFSDQLQPMGPQTADIDDMRGLLNA